MLEELRADRTAPVDRFGSEVLPDRPPVVTQDEFEFQTLVCLMLSSQTKDPVVGAAVERMRAANLLSVDFMRTKSFDQVEKVIYGVGFHKRKATFLVNSANIIHDEHNGKVPSTFHGLCSLPGVGPKMAMIVMDVAFDQCLGVSIDTHLHRMLQQLGFVKKSKNPEDTRRQLESWLPRKYWKNMNLVWVGLGQEIQTEKVKLIGKALESSDPKYALKLLKTFGMDVNKIAKKEGLDMPYSR